MKIEDSKKYEKTGTSDGYFKMPEEGKYHLHVLDSEDEMVEGYQLFTDTIDENGKPIKQVKRWTMEESVPPDDVKYFWATRVWNIDLQKVQIWVITQTGIREALRMIRASKWADLRSCDLTLTREGTGFTDTKYSVVAEPPEKLELTPEQDIYVNLKALFKGEDPFAQKADIPFTERPNPSRQEDLDDGLDHVEAPF